ncbi:hypothetical protein [Rahnella variigena]|uniref:Uncharacterized protein n=1 Tax=Rahnella variigena TaxID=574964 RepID=A0ABX9PWD9_9GAMM|nr:hypothetical protein [Rahnella variigena]RJT50745.1 hypothetical protein D6D38_19675 [Rahnella variigena]RKF69275.1 hypothetical protein CKQ54_13280 [Rahnella variigena]
MKNPITKVILISCTLLALYIPAHAGMFDSAIDLSKPFTCKDVSPSPMRITEKGLIMGGVLYPVYNSNAATTPVLTNTIFRSRDNLEEIDIVQYASNGKISVSYMKFYSDPDKITDYEEIDNNKIFEKASREAVDPKPFYHSKNAGCKQ